MKISVIIPTYNEEKYLPKLLESLSKQTFTDFEVIVADANSTDRTAEIAQEYGARVVEGGMPARGRNAGAAVAQGDFFFFFDADVKLNKRFLENAYREMQDEYMDLATCAFHPLSTSSMDRLIHLMLNFVIRSSVKIDPKAFGLNIFVTKRLFERVDGFDESVKLSEDSDFVRRASHFRPLCYLVSDYVRVSVRRFKKEGRLNYAAKGLRMHLYRSLKGEIREDVIEYEFGNFDASRAENKTKLDKLESMLMKAEKEYRIQRKKIRTALGKQVAEVEQLRGELAEKSVAATDKMKRLFSDLIG